MSVVLQRTPEWFAMRAGKVTGSRVGDVIAKTKAGKWTAAREHYKAELIAERLTQEVAEPGPQSAAMRWGAEKEDEARSAYEFYRDVEIGLAAFVDHPTLSYAGCSPDGLIGEDGGCEIKCPNAATHLETLLSQAPPEEYRPQIQWNMACTGRRWWDYVSYDPRMPESMRLFVYRVLRDNSVITTLENEVGAFNAEIYQTVVQLRGLYEQKAAA